MKTGWKMGVCIFAAMLLLGVTTMVQAETQLKQLGQSPFFALEMKSVADFQQMVKKTLPDLKKGFEMAGAADLLDEFVNQTNQSKIETIDVKTGEKLQWMVFKKGKTVKVIRDVVWAGKKPFKAFQVTVEKSGKRYTFITPAKCGNVSLAQITALPPAPSAQPLPVQAPPAPVAKTPEPSPPAPVQKADQEIVATPLGHLVADLGVMYQNDPATYLLFRVGYDYRIRENFSILGMIGFAPVIHGDDDTNSVLVDLTGIYHYQRMYVGAGVGYWYSSDDDRVDFILNIGYRIWERDQRNLSLFIEGRSAFDEFDELDEYGRYGVGLRFQF
ncbi:MAG: hypothetical protein AB7S77_14230 [Desulfatirhabdiaceae bacterium]